jgi:very-short-patch-repair endonuclease
MSSVLRRAGMSDAVTEYTITDDHGGFIAVADFAYPDHRVAVEVDGFEFHSSPKAVDMGNARDRLLLGAGWIVLHFSWTDVEHRPHRVADEIRHILNVRHAG